MYMPTSSVDYLRLFNKYVFSFCAKCVFFSLKMAYFGLPYTTNMFKIIFFLNTLIIRDLSSYAPKMFYCRKLVAVLYS